MDFLNKTIFSTIISNSIFNFEIYSYLKMILLVLLLEIWMFGFILSLPFLELDHYFIKNITILVSHIVKCTFWTFPLIIINVTHKYFTESDKRSNLFLIKILTGFIIIAMIISTIILNTLS